MNALVPLNAAAGWGRELGSPTRLSGIVVVVGVVLSGFNEGTGDDLRKITGVAREMASPEMRTKEASLTRRRTCEGKRRQRRGSNQT